MEKSDVWCVYIGGGWSGIYHCSDFRDDFGGIAQSAAIGLWNSDCVKLTVL